MYCKGFVLACLFAVLLLPLTGCGNQNEDQLNCEEVWLNKHDYYLCVQAREMYIIRKLLEGELLTEDDHKPEVKGIA